MNLHQFGFSFLLLISLVFNPPVVIAGEATPLREIRPQLVDSGWEYHAAQSVAKLNAWTFSVMQEENPHAYARMMQWLMLLPQEDSSLMLTIREHPELAGLLATSDDPVLMAGTLRDGTCYTAFVGFYQLMLDRSEQHQLAKTLKQHGAIICQLVQEGVPMPFTLFMFDHSNTVGREYALWLKEALQQAMASRNGERLAEVIAFATSNGKGVRKRMVNDEHFLRLFRQRLWSAFWRVTGCAGVDCVASFETLADEPGVWDLLAQPDGEVLLEKWGLDAVALLSGTRYIPSTLHRIARKALLETDYRLVKYLFDFGRKSTFQRLLRQDLTKELHLRMLADMDQYCMQPNKECDERMNLYVRLSPIALSKELAPEASGPATWIPLYSVYNLGQKVLDGRPVSKLDIAFAGVDVVTLVWVVGKGGKIIAQKLVRDSSKKVAQKTATNVMKRLPSKMTPGRRKGLEKLAQHSPTANAKTYLQPWVEKAQNLKSGYEDATRLDITKPLQWTFNKSGVGRESVKKLTGLEARVFMRKDARVIIDPKKGAFGGLLRETAERAMADTAGNVWEQHASTWFLVQAAIP